MKCIFCQIVNGEAPRSAVYENDSVIVFHDKYPKAPTHLLICPKRHYRDLLEAPPEVARDLHLAIKDVARIVGTVEHGVRIQVNNGAGAGQIVFHLHYHFFSRKKISHEPVK